MFLTLSFVFAATGPEQILYGYGPLGVATVALSVVGYKMFNIILTDRDKAIAQRDQMLNDFNTKVLPALTRSTEVLQSRQEIDVLVMEAIKESTAKSKDLGEVLSEVKFVLRNRAGGA